jgi:glycosyltransferase involved in cell wall biosynthesis
LKKIVVFTENYEKGGGNRYMIDLTNFISENYKQITLLSNRGGVFDSDIKRLKAQVLIENIYFLSSTPVIRKTNLLAFRLIRLLVKYFFLVIEPLTYLVNIPLFLFFLIKSRPSKVLCCNGGYPGAQAPLAMIMAAKLLRIPTVLSIVSMPAKVRRGFYLFSKILDLIVWRSCDLVIVNAQAIKYSLIANRGAHQDKIRVIYNGLEDSPEPLNRNEIARFTIGCVARMDVSKGIPTLFDAFAELSDEYPNIVLVLAGDGDYLIDLSKRLFERGLEDRIILLGHYDGSIPDLLASFDVYVFPSWWEGFPYSILEALRAGSVIVASNVGGIPEAIFNNENGILVTPKSSDDICAALRLLIEDPKLRQHLSSNARSTFLNFFTLDKMAKQVSKIID